MKGIAVCGLTLTVSLLLIRCAKRPHPFKEGLNRDGFERKGRFGRNRHEQVVPESQAEKAGLLPGDQWIAIVLISSTPI